MLDFYRYAGLEAFISGYQYKQRKNQSIYQIDTVHKMTEEV